MGPAWRQVYMAALERGYRFLSFGDAMLADATIEPGMTHAATLDPDRTVMVPPAPGPSPSPTAAFRLPPSCRSEPGRRCAASTPPTWSGRSPDGPRQHLPPDAPPRGRADRRPRRPASSSWAGTDRSSPTRAAIRSSLDPRIDEQGAVFQVHLRRFVRPPFPRTGCRVQQLLGPDVAMALDVWSPSPPRRRMVRAAMERTLRWEERALASTTGPTRRCSESFREGATLVCGRSRLPGRLLSGSPVPSSARSPTIPSRGSCSTTSPRSWPTPTGSPSLIEAMTAPFRASGITKVAGIEARGFTLAARWPRNSAPDSCRSAKPGKLPYEDRSARTTTSSTAPMPSRSMPMRSDEGRPGAAGRRRDRHRRHRLGRHLAAQGPRVRGGGLLGVHRTGLPQRDAALDGVSHHALLRYD
jgi:hypothetical protein